MARMDIMQEVIELCQTLIRIPSVNPEDRKGFQSPYGEFEIAEFIFNWFSSFGLNPQLQQVEENRNNVFVLAQGRDTSKTLLLSSHMDTVDVKDMTVEPFAANITDGRIYGRGACDDKGPLSAMMIAFRDRVAQGKLPFNLAFLATCGEEYNMTGARHFVENLSIPIAGALFGEPTSFKAVVSHKGVVRLQLQSQGQSAHCSRPKTGRNAIYPMARAVTAIEEFIESMDQWPQHPQLGRETVAVTIINGGQQINVIPDRCQARVDWRILPGTNALACRDKLEKFLRSKSSEEISVELLSHYEPMRTDHNSPLVIAILDTTDRVSNIRQTSIMTGATDASAFISLGIPTPILGPGNTEHAHTKNEYIDTADLEKGLVVYNAYLDGDWGL